MDYAALLREVMSVHVASTYELAHDLFFLRREQFSIAPKNGGKTQSDVVRAFAYLLMKTLSATPRPLYPWKAETVSFLHVLLVWGSI